MKGKNIVFLVVGLLIGFSLGAWKQGGKASVPDDAQGASSRAVRRDGIGGGVNGPAITSGKNASPQFESVEDEIDAFRKVLSSGSSYETKLDFYRMLNEMTTEAAPQINQLVGELHAQGHALDTVGNLFWQRWGEIDGEAACAAIFDIDKRFPETGYSNIAIASWARKDPEAAAAWLSAQNDVPLRDGMMKGLLEGMVDADPAKAQRYMAESELTEDQKALGFNRIAKHWLREGGTDGVGEWYAGFNADDPSIQTASNAAADAYTNGIVDDALEWANGLDPDSPQTDYVRNRLYQNLARYKPDALVTYMGYVAGAPDLGGATELAEQGVAHWVRGNPIAMGEWLVDNSHIPNYDLVVAPFVREIAGHDPEAAVAWAKTIKDTELRDLLGKQLNRD